MPADLVLLGEFGRAHGLKGEVRLKSYTGDPLAIGTYGPLATADRRTITLQSLRRAPGEAPDMLVARVAGVADRDAAEALNRLALYAPRDRLGAADEDEFFLADLIGLAVRDEVGAPVGTIVAVPNYGGGDLLEIAPPEGPTRLLPFTKAVVPAVDLAGGFVTVAAVSLVEGEDESQAPDSRLSLRHAEERPQGASRSTHDRGACFETARAAPPQHDEVGSLRPASQDEERGSSGGGREG